MLVLVLVMGFTFGGFVYTFLFWMVMRRRTYVISRGYDGTLMIKKGLFFSTFLSRRLVSFSCHSHEMDSSHKRSRVKLVIAPIANEAPHHWTEIIYEAILSLLKTLCTVSNYITLSRYEKIPVGI